VGISFTVCLFVCLFVCVCTVTDFSAEDKASGVKFCTAVYREISYFCERCSPRSPKSVGKSASARATHRCNISREVGSACVDIGQFPLTYLHFIIVPHNWAVLFCSMVSVVCRRRLSTPSVVVCNDANGRAGRPPGEYMDG